jgi:hypothetical protein
LRARQNRPATWLLTPNEPMKERNELLVTGLVILLVILWLGFPFHRAPRFAGSLAGGVLAVTGSALMLVPLVYSIIKRIKALRDRIAPRVQMRTLLSWHIYAGVLGPILVLLHTGHKFQSHLGIALTAMTIIVVLSGFTGRYLLSKVAQTIGEKKKMLTQFELAYRQTATELAAHPEQVAVLQSFSGFFGRLLSGLFTLATEAGPGTTPASIRALQLSESIADVEYAIRTHETFKRAFSIWLKLHITLSFTLYALLALHIWASLRFGLRWFA